MVKDCLSTWSNIVAVFFGGPFSWMGIKYQFCDGTECHLFAHISGIPFGLKLYKLLIISDGVKYELNVKKPVKDHSLCVSGRNSLLKYIIDL